MSQPFFFFLFSLLPEHTTCATTLTRWMAGYWINTPSRLSQVAPRRLGKSTYTHTHTHTHRELFKMFYSSSLGLSAESGCVSCTLFPFPIVSPEILLFFFHPRQRNTQFYTLETVLPDCRIHCQPVSYSF